MSTIRTIPQSISGRLFAMSIAKTKKDGIVLPAVNILSDATSERLDLDLAAYKNSRDHIIAAKATHHAAVALAKPQRLLLKTFVTSFYTSLNNEISIGDVPKEARSYYGLNITNKRMPAMGSDANLLSAAESVLSGDILRRAAGGKAITSPTIAAFTLIFGTAQPIILAVSNAQTSINEAVHALAVQTIEIKDLITHIWDEVEAHYSLNSPSNRRAECRLWGVKYRSTGVLSVVTGTCKDEAGVVLAGIKVRIIGANTSTLSDALGHFSINTSLYGDLELEATHLNYENNMIEFTKEDGVAIAVAVVMTHI